MSPGASYNVRYDPLALKELTKLDHAVARRIVKAVDVLTADPRPAGTQRLVGYSDLWRMRVGDYRVIYSIQDAVVIVTVLRVAHRSAAYRNL